MPDKTKITIEIEFEPSAPQDQDYEIRVIDLSVADWRRSLVNASIQVRTTQTTVDRWDNLSL